MHSNSVGFESDEHFMHLALAQARAAADAGEVPVGAVVVKAGQVIATGRNAPIGSHDPTAHAEIVALRNAAQVLGNYRLDGCELFVTLEPCAMCSGAVLHARLARVVFGAPDPKTGACGSVLNMFALPSLNHHTVLRAGVLADAASAILQDFFFTKRAVHAQQRQAQHPLRDDAVRTPGYRFENLPEYPWSPRYVNDLPALAGLRMHYLDEGTPDAPLTYLCLHGNMAWSYTYRKMIPVLLQSGARVLAPDLIGFGKSDKPKKESAHSLAWHRQTLLEWVNKLDLRNVVLVLHGWDEILGWTLPVAAPQRFVGLLAMNATPASWEHALLSKEPCTLHEFGARRTAFDYGAWVREMPLQLTPAECAAFTAPFPDKGHCGAMRAMAKMLPTQADGAFAECLRQTREFWAEHWSGKTLMAISPQDPMMGLVTLEALQMAINQCPDPICVEALGKLALESGEMVAHAAVQRFCTHQIEQHL